MNLVWTIRGPPTQIQDLIAIIEKSNTDVTDQIEKHSRITKPKTDVTDQIEKHSRITKPNTDVTD